MSGVLEGLVKDRTARQNLFASRRMLLVLARENMTNICKMCWVHYISNTAYKCEDTPELSSSFLPHLFLMSSALINRSLTTIRTELDFLRESDVISEGLYQQIINQLPEKHSPGMAAASSIKNEPVAQDKWEPPKGTKSTPTIAPVPSAAPSYSNNLELAEAMYDYTAQEKEDLSLRVGDKIEITDKLSPDWWRGKVNGREGIFPANYVKLLDSTRQVQSPPPVSQAQRYEYQPPIQAQPSGAPSANYDYPSQPIMQQTQQYPGQNYGSPQPYPQQLVQTQPMIVQQPEQAQSGEGSQQFNRHAKKFGSKLGNAAIFGAGATIGSNIVNSIF